MGLDKTLSRCLKGHLCNLGIQKPFVVDIPKKHNTIKNKFALVSVLVFNVTMDIIFYF